MRNLRTLSAATRLFVFLLACVLAFSMMAAFGGALYVTHAFAAEGMEGEWTARTSAKHPGEVQIDFSRRSDHDNYVKGDTYKISELQGLASNDLASAARADVKFSIVREAGTLNCDGMFRDGMGTGFWKFSPSAAFRADMKNRGYGSLTDEEMLRAAFGNLTGKYIDDLKTAGYANLEFDELVRAANHEITVAYIREMRSAYPNLSMEDLIRAHNHDVDASYLKQVRDMGFDKQPLEEVIRMQNHEITPEFIASMKSAGFDNLSIDDLVRLKNHEVTPEFVADIKAEGFTGLSADTAIRLRSHDVDRDFIRKAKAQGYTNLDLDDLIRLKNRGTIKE